MRKLAGASITVGLVGGIWAVLAAIAWWAGVLPDSGRPGTDTTRSSEEGPADGGYDGGQNGGHDAGHDASNAETEPGGSVAGGGAGAGSEVPSEVGTDRAVLHAFPLAHPLHPYVVSLTVGQLLGDPHPEIVVGLGDRFEVLSVGPAADGAPDVTRILTVTQDSPEPDFVRSSPRAAIGDVTGDGRDDLVLAFWRRSAAGGSRGGGAWLLRATADGLDRPRRLAGPFVMATSVALLDLDGRRGLDVVIGDRGRPYGDIAGRARILSGGARPRELGDYEGPLDVRMVLPAHVDADDAIDLVVVGETVTRLRNLGRGRFERLEDDRDGILFADVPRGYSADLDGDGTLEAYAYTNANRSGTLIVGASGYRFVPWDFQPAHDQNGLVYPLTAVVDVDGDGRREALVLHLVRNDWQLATFDAAGEPLALRRLHGGHPRQGHDGTIVDLDRDGSPEVVTLDSVYDRRRSTVGYELTIAPLCVGCPLAREVGAIREQEGATRYEVR